MHSVLENIGLTRNEIKVYLALLSLESTTTGPLIKKTGLHTSKVYDALERLSDKGVVSHYLEDNTKHFKAVDPVRLIDFLAEKKRTLNRQEQEILNIIPFLQKQRRSDDDETEAEIFRGWKGIDTAYTLIRKTLKKGEGCSLFGANNGDNPEETTKFFQHHNLEMARKGLYQHIVFNESTRPFIGVLKDYPRLFNLRYLPHTTPAEINIWADHVMITILSKKPTVVLMKNKRMAEAFLEYFKIMWALAKP